MLFICIHYINDITQVTAYCSTLYILVLNLSLPAIRNIEDDIARSLLDLSQTPVHANTTPVIPPSYHTPADTSYASTSFPTKAVDFSSRAQSTSVSIFSLTLN